MNQQVDDKAFFTFAPGFRVMILLLTTLVGLIIGSILVAIVVRNGQNTATLRLATVVQDVMLFVTPAVATAAIVVTKPWSLLRFNSVCAWGILFGVLGLLTAMPAMNALVVWNESITMPESLSWLEELMQNSEQQAQASIEMLFGGSGWSDLIASVLIIGVLAGLSEELFFRGCLQRILATISQRGQLSEPSNFDVHRAIWITAVIFSAFHMQFYGFFPRLLLGAYLGYLLWLTKSIWTPVIVHALNNTIVVVSTWLHQRGSVAVDVNELGQSSIFAVVCSVAVTGWVIWCLAYLSGRSVTQTSCDGK